MSQYILSQNATSSLCDIKLYSSKTFGEQQTKKYLEKIRNQMRILAKNPNKGSKRSDIKPGYFSIPIGSHIIYYKIDKNHVKIIDILHQKMDPLTNLETPNH